MLVTFVEAPLWTSKSDALQVRPSPSGNLIQLGREADIERNWIWVMVISGS